MKICDHPLEKIAFYECPFRVCSIFDRIFIQTIQILMIFFNFLRHLPKSETSALE